ncbi:hypothetical protein ACFLYK_04420, partial [Candidatus Cloacimonadota bacterium]
MKNLSICLFLLFFGFLAAGIVDLDQLPEELRISVVPDVMGKVLVSDDYQDDLILPGNSTRDLPTVLEGFPVSYSVSNCYKGAIYTNMDEDDEMEIIFGVGTKIAAVNLDGSAVPGFPVNNS